MKTYRNPQIQEVLSALNLQMDDVAKNAGITYQELAEYATTSMDVPEDVIMKIANAIGVDTSVFFNDEYLKLDNPK